ncbi:pollen-specific leucine-rich repeat extensin-like protein 4 [Iris pallida]|uniref:Pollen-specific leucine-rich repeat extensin-like protein 4 n=1 Tax=Iris pallida TaxID=29817 RepID=A0AAX6HR00_IRIPA|nr:pollen-specific leucine-rich repeat extensin-like protein 4 [Iris pallida]
MPPARTDPPCSARSSPPRPSAQPLLPRVRPLLPRGAVDRSFRTAPSTAPSARRRRPLPHLHHQNRRPTVPTRLANFGHLPKETRSCLRYGLFPTYRHLPVHFGASTTPSLLEPMLTSIQIQCQHPRSRLPSCAASPSLAMPPCQLDYLLLGTRTLLWTRILSCWTQAKFDEHLFPADYGVEGLVDDDFEVEPQP